jgi:Cellulose biosynthesis protein BcsS
MKAVARPFSAQTPAPLPARRSKFLLAAALWIVQAQAAGAADWYTGDKTTEPDYAPTVVLDASGSATTTQSVFGAAAVTGAIDGDLRQNGFRFRVEGVAGTYNYFTTLPTVTPGTIGVRKKIYADQEDGGVLGGYGWVTRNWSFALFGGMELSNTTLSSPDPNNPTAGFSIGAKIAGEFYGNPTPNTMLSGYGSFSTNNSEYYSRIKAGYRIWGNVFIGPEFLALGNRFYSEYRAGIHLTGFTISRFAFGLSGGATSSRVTGSGGYALLDAQLTF